MTPKHVTLWVVERFWKAVKARPRLGGDRVESALIEIASAQDACASTGWAAVLLHAESIRPEHIDAVLFGLEHQSVGDYPSSDLLRALGFQVGISKGTCTHAGDNESHRPADVLGALRHCKLLNHQAIAEIVLAVTGNKMSRISGSSALFAKLARHLDLPFFISSQSIKSVRDCALCGFSNRSVLGNQISDLSGDYDVYAYFGGSFADQALLAVLDQLNAGGGILGIPPCCRAFFAKEWAHACQLHDGDLAYHLLSAHGSSGEDQRIELAWQCNPYGMYMGGGLMWHFPCSLRCKATIAIVNARHELLASIDPEFADECRAFQVAPLQIDPDRSFHHGTSSKGGNSLKADVTVRTDHGPTGCCDRLAGAGLEAKEFV